jgi:hypothetical protein
LNAGYRRWAQTVDGVGDDEQKGMRFGATLALPVNRHLPWLYGIGGYGRITRLQTLGIAWQYRWGRFLGKPACRYTPPAR